MAKDALSTALDRLQHSLDQLESIATAAPPPPRDERLRAEVQAVIAELDRMIGKTNG